MEDRSRHRRKSIGRRGTKQNSKLKKVAELIVDPNDTRTLKEKFESEGVTDETFLQMLDDEKILGYVNRLIEKYTELERSQIWTALIKGAKAGDVRAIKLYFELKKESKKKLSSPEMEEIAIKWLNCEGQGDDKNFHPLLPNGDADDIPQLPEPLQAPQSRKKSRQDNRRRE